MARFTASMAVVFIVAFLLASSVVWQASAAITCGQVVSSLGQCLAYIRSVRPLTPACCGGITQLNAQAQTTADRQEACSCIKNLAGGIPGLNPYLAAGLPGKCGVRIPYPISTSTDCTKVQ